MTVKELIEMLQQVSPTLIAHVDSTHNNDTLVKDLIIGRGKCTVVNLDVNEGD